MNKIFFLKLTLFLFIAVAALLGIVTYLTIKSLKIDVGSLFAFAAIVISIISLYHSGKWYAKDRSFSDDKELLEELKLSLEISYNALSLADSRHRRDRWLSAARHIERYREMKKKLKTSLHQKLCELHEDYWSDKIFHHLSVISDTEFSESIEGKKIEDQIDIKSAGIIFSFSAWKDERKDPLSHVDLETLIHEYKLNSPIHKSFWYYVQRKRPQFAIEYDSKYRTKPIEFETE